MYVPHPFRFQYRSRLKNAEKVARLALGTGAENLRLKPNYENLKMSSVSGTNDPFLRERFLQTVLTIVGDK